MRLISLDTATSHRCFGVRLLVTTTAAKTHPEAQQDKMPTESLTTRSTASGEAR